MATSPSTPTGGVAAAAYKPAFRLTPEKYSALNDLLEAKGSTEADAINKPEVRDLLIKSYGDQGITGFLKLTGAINNAGTADQIEFFEEGRRHRTFTIDAVEGGGNATGASDNFEVSVDESAVAGDDPATSKFFQTRDVVMNTSSGVRYLVINDNRSSAGDVNAITLARLDGEDLTSADNVTTATEFVVLGNLYEQGSDQPQHFMQPELKRYKNPFMIIKDRYQVNGSQATNVGYVNIGNGDYRWFMYGEQEARKRFEDRREMMMLYGELHDGSNAPGGVAGSEGYFAAIKDRGLVATGANAAPLTLSNFDDIIIELDKQGAPAEYAMYLNRKQDLAIDDMLAAGIATQVTAGLAGQFGAFNNDADLAVKLGFKSFTRGGYTFHKHDWKLLNDPTLAGASTKIQGAMCPMTQVTDPRSGTKAPALEMNYKASNGYSREMEHWVTGGGIMGHTNGDAGKDVMTFHYRSEINLITRAANQHVLIEG